MNKITAVTANDDFSLDLQFNDGSVKRFNVKPYLDYEVFRELNDLNYFKQCPETLYLEGLHVSDNGDANG